MPLISIRTAAADIGYKTPDRLLRYLREEAPDIGAAVGLDLMGSGTFGVDSARWKGMLPELLKLAQTWKSWRRSNLGRHAQPHGNRPPTQHRTRRGYKS